MKVQIAGVAAPLDISSDDIDGEVRWIDLDVCEGRLLDGRLFRCRVSPEEWGAFLDR